MTEIVLILTTMPDDEQCDALAQTLVDERLAACVSVGAPTTSFYRWQGTVERERERQMIIKTTRALVEQVRLKLGELHPYELPEFLVVAVDDGGAEYLAWINAQTAGPAA